MYDGLVCPDYQIWRYKKKDEKQKIVNVDIVVPVGLSDEQVQKACKHLEERFARCEIITINAYEENINSPLL